ncbi:cell division protein FtsX [Enterococcus florum]|uniref:Cell division protein FtsX n=1 Tax=Enterococcus florum TaxID=2480627 RepID=A0A4P5PCU3_9ENTE|nr:permease-like cell division protein FtsX [Enterococcus florum]GCF93808.1 cell division protein FtsX [Enterococcus florum]
MRRYTFKKMFREGLQNIRRHQFMSAASLLIIVVTMTFLSLLLALSFNIRSFSAQLEENVAIHTFVEVSASKQDIDSLQKDIQKLPNVQSVTFKSKKQSVKEIIERYGSAFEMLQGKANPLYDKFVIKVKKERAIKQTNQKIEALKHVAESNYGDQTADELLRTTKTLRRFGWLLFGLGSVFTVLILFITLMMGIKSRQEEIQTRTLLGATPLYISMPFLIQGVFMSLLGSLAASGIALASYAWLTGLWQKGLRHFGYHFVEVRELLLLLPLLTIGTSLVIGLISAKIAVSSCIRYPK